MCVYAVHVYMDLMGLRGIQRANWVPMKNKNRNGIYIGGLWKNVSLKNEDTNSMADLARE